MPVQKRSTEHHHLDGDSRHQSNHHLYQQQKQKHEDPDSEKVEGKQHGGGEDSDRSTSSSSGGEKDEYLIVKLSDVRKDVQCPICLGIIRKTRTVMECLHRFCRECIDKSMRLGNNECPACRTHCASRRSLRDDPNYDTLIATLYPNIDKYEKELVYREEEKSRNKQIQDYIAETYQRQSEALGKKQPRTKAVRKPQGVRRRGRKRKNQATRFEESDDDDFSENGESSSDEQCEDIKPKRCKSSKAPHSSEPSSASANADLHSHENNTIDVSRESRGVSPGSIGKPEVPVWGKGGTRSHTRVTRHGSVSSGSGRSTRSSRLVNLVDYVVGLDENDNEVR